MTRYVLEKYTLIGSGKAEYKGVTFGKKEFFDCETLEEAKEIAHKAAITKTTYQLKADLGKKRPNGCIWFEGVYKFQNDERLI